MRAVAYTEPLSIDHETALIDVDLPKPTPIGRDLLVEIKAVSVNPVDTKVRRGVKPEPGTPKILGWDAAGIVVATGPEVSLFKVGDDVFYAGAIDRPGTNAEYHLVDERIVGPKPTSLDFAEAAALPLTAITAWEALFDRLRVNDRQKRKGDAILIIGGAGGVGSIAIQLARLLTDLTIIATASRPETQEWCRDLGAHYVVNHNVPLAAEVAKLGIGAPSFVFSTTGTEEHLADIVELIAPQGHLCVIDDAKTLDVMAFKRKCVALHWELMFTRSLFHTPDMFAQHELLSEVSRLVDAGKIRTTLNQTLGPITAVNLRKAHALIETGRTKGKIVLAGF
ncbi:zinc-binding alcohol dehydrogenase family protein [Lichenihabitans sp. PAMC28606]|uniref:zinc-binding alcohol dehydrogenase family protein n=1 Tax=Lichenihabitans sp. PAMC28606 TaxID=2880932 RepID=UPI001D0B23E5|nr:zinc-binding alcohol dehydrogenase family protein [Lichenihabitans sp. PAMC28606]UDL96473.1 zinc-binding alcohol dehydrogenase family protein [Lichenihabitans sp. PAMC28606]